VKFLGTLAGLAGKAGTFFVGNWKVIFAALAIMPAVFLLGQCSGKKSERAAWEAVSAKAAVVAEKAQRLADAARSARATADRDRIAANRQEIDRALANIPDQALTARQRERVLIELRRQAAASGSAHPASGPLDPRR
jgi:predicted Fe-S protein YdhL (DUF1289 family)